MSNKSRSAYPNILSNTDLISAQDRKPLHRSARRFSEAVARKYAIEDAKNEHTPRFECEHCHTFFSMSFAVFVRDTTKFFSEAKFICRSCYKEHKSRYQKA